VGRVLWLPDRLRDFGLTPQVDPGFATAGSSALYARGVVCHHTASGAGPELPSYRVVIDGRPDLRGPLCANSPHSCRRPSIPTPSLGPRMAQ
jgi:hypothetical protein